MKYNGFTDHIFLIWHPRHKGLYKAGCLCRESIVKEDNLTLNNPAKIKGGT